MTINPDALSIANLLDSILDKLVVGFTEAGIDLPERRYWTTSRPAPDCEQLVVFFNQAYVGPVGDEAAEPQRCNSPRTAQIDIQILRCIPGMAVGHRNARPPTAEQIQAGAAQQVIDAWMLLDLACTLDDWDGELGGAGMGVIATVDAGEPQGGLQGSTMHLTVAIP